MNELFMASSLRVTAILIAPTMMEAVKNFDATFQTEEVLICKQITWTQLEERITNDLDVPIIRESGVVLSVSKLVLIAIGSLMEA